MAQNQSDESLGRDYWCFISYRHADNREIGRQWASWLHHELETYEVPSDLVGKVNDRGDEIPSRLYPIFRDEEELPADAELSSPIERALQRSRFLVVICSPAAAASRFVDDEVRIFKQLGKADRVLAMIISGEPNASERPQGHLEALSRGQECFPISLRRVVNAQGEITEKQSEPVGADFRLHDGTEGWTSPEAYRQALMEQGIPKSKIPQLVSEYSSKIRLMKLKIVAGIMGIPLGVLTKRDQAYELEKAKKRAKTLRRWLVVVSIAMIAAVFAGLVAAWQWREATRAASRAIAARSQAEELIEFMSFKMRDNLSSIGRLDLMDQINSEVEKYNLSKQQIAQETGGSESAKEIFRLAASRSNAADSLKAKGQIAEAFALYKESLELNKQAVALEPENLHFIHGLSVDSAKLGDCAQGLGDLFKADVYYKFCVATRRNLVELEPDNPRWSMELAKSYRHHAGLLAGQDKLDEAENLVRLGMRSLEKIQATAGSNPEFLHGRAASYSSLGNILMQKKAFADAKNAYEQTMAAANSLVSMEPDNVNWKQVLSVAHGKLGTVSMEMEDYKSAENHYKESLKIDEKLSSADPLNNERRFGVYLALEQLAELADKTVDHELALSRYRQAVGVLDELLSTKDGDQNFNWLVKSEKVSLRLSELLAAEDIQPEAEEWKKRAEDHERKARQVWEANQKLSE
jgi:tetratricopeptide (TPR) repeat protein